MKIFFGGTKMTIKQISIFIENKPETLSELTDVLAKNNVNMRAIMLADTSDFGVVRLIVDNPDETAKLLEENDYVIKANGVIAIQIPDEAGSLNSILKLLGQNGRNVEYMYGFTGSKTNTACMILRCSDVPVTEKVLEDAGIVMISQDDLSNI